MSEHRDSRKEAKSVTFINETRMCTERERETEEIPWQFKPMAA